MTHSILQDTSLCAIVRDELINPAGGIKRFVRAIMPHVEAGVIFDTGSVDGTRQALENLQAEFPNLDVYDRPFDDYAGARNASLRKVKTKRALVLDADELITKKGFQTLGEVVESSNAIGYNFIFNHVSPDNIQGKNIIGAHNPRLFNQSKRIRYALTRKYKSFEMLYLYPTPVPLFPSMQLQNGKNVHSLHSDTPIIHFLPGDKDGANLKFTDWYDSVDFSKAPSRCPHFRKWKAYNPRRDDYNN